MIFENKCVSEQCASRSFKACSAVLSPLRGNRVCIDKELIRAAAQSSFIQRNASANDSFAPGPESSRLLLSRNVAGSSTDVESKFKKHQPTLCAFFHSV